MPAIPTTDRSNEQRIISASRRTDIPRYYARWFGARRRAGWAEFRNAFGMAGRVSLKREDVLAYLFWTRDPGPLAAELADLRAEGIPYAFQFTITGLDRAIEPHVPRVEHAVDAFLSVAADLPAPDAVQWRYDPLVVTAEHDGTWHRRSFARLAARLAGATRVVNTSIVEPYLKAVRRMPPDPSTTYRRPDPRRHRTVVARHPDLRTADAGTTSLLADMSAIAADHGMELRVCSNPELPLPPSTCCGAELFAPFPALGPALAALDTTPSRPGCRCLPSVDIGMDNTCVAGCRYCYVVTSQPTAARNLQNHDPTAPSLR